MPSFSCTIEDELPSGLRLDRYIAEQLKILSRSQIKVRKLKAKLNGKPVKISRVLKAGDSLELSWQEAESPFLIPQDIPLDVIYEDSRVIVVNKAQGMVVHPGAGNWQGTLANALLCRKLINAAKNPSIGNFNVMNQKDSAAETWPNMKHPGLRPGIVHRLDKDTSGVIIAAWDGETQTFLSEQFKSRKVRKGYAALVQGCPKDKLGCIDTRIIRSRRDRKTFVVSDKEGRTSLTYFKLVRSYGNYSLLLLRPKTGRTHQLRVHLKYLGTPILGDALYGRPDSVFPKATLMLHSKSLSLVLPGEKEKKKFRAQLPLRFLEVMNHFCNQ